MYDDNDIADYCANHHRALARALEREATRDEPCDYCGELQPRDRMFWHGDALIGDCCDTEPLPTHLL